MIIANIAIFIEAVLLGYMLLWLVHISKLSLRNKFIAGLLICAFEMTALATLIYTSI